MFELDETNAADYLRRQGRLNGPARVTTLAGGVSNVVLLIETDQDRFVLKQSRPQLRTKDPWFSDVDRIHREVAAIQTLGAILGDAVPRFLFDDPENYAFAMSAAPKGAKSWRDLLLAGEIDDSMGRRAAALLASVHQAGRDNPSLRAPFIDPKYFHQLRLEPYYLRLRDRRPEWRESLSRLIDAMAAAPKTLAHGDYSPKNFLARGDTMLLVDHETVHAGDAAFDVGFMLAHLALKAIHRAPNAVPMLSLYQSFAEEYFRRSDADSETIARSLRHQGAIMLVRLVGTSPVDYLTDSSKRIRAEELATRLLADENPSWTNAADLPR